MDVSCSVMNVSEYDFTKYTTPELKQTTVFCIFELCAVLLSLKQST